ncbi:hypothetical protein K432DRAFT_233840 [Lepidopterella palustris CBS 459.81]|uniref:Uncharacterized protein n=1 Tax=Lepidopterella palustris CBS 459.81 TaxID=1314670 RepID=A0A8E2DXC2_9PEZI|nr:hypothetical protein K432DRAFT_233840 [Lepidopterella palustris CBS 459.81]
MDTKSPWSDRSSLLPPKHHDLPRLGRVCRYLKLIFSSTHDILFLFHKLIAVPASHPIHEWQLILDINVSCGKLSYTTTVPTLQHSEHSELYIHTSIWLLLSHSSLYQRSSSSVFMNKSFPRHGPLLSAKPTGQTSQSPPDMSPDLLQSSTPRLRPHKSPSKYWIGIPMPLMPSSALVRPGRAHLPYQCHHECVRLSQRNNGS